MRWWRWGAPQRAPLSFRDFIAYATFATEYCSGFAGFLCGFLPPLAVFWRSDKFRVEEGRFLAGRGSSAYDDVRVGMLEKGYIGTVGGRVLRYRLASATFHTSDRSDRSPVSFHDLDLSG